MLTVSRGWESIRAYDAAEDAQAAGEEVIPFERAVEDIERERR